MRRGFASHRWFQLLVGIASMVMIANLQYGWNLFVDPIDARHHWGRAAIQVAFSTFVVMETWLVPVEGWFVDRFGPRAVVMLGGVLVAIGWTINSVAHWLPVLYGAAALSGIGAGAVYGTCIGNALKWFPDRRGLAAGLTAAGFGAGAALTVIPIQHSIAARGYEATFLWFGLGQGLAILVLAQLLRPAAPDRVPSLASRARQPSRDFTPVEVLRSPVFWAMYAMFVLVSATGLIILAQLASIAQDFGVAQLPVGLLGLAWPALTLALAIDNVLNGVARPFFGWVSDRIGRENTMFIVFGAGALSLWSLYAFRHDAAAFVILSGLVFFTWGEIYSLFPSTCTDTYGSAYATTNAGMLYTAKGSAAILVPAASGLVGVTGDWAAVFMAAAIMNAVAALMALFVLKPLRIRHYNLIAAAPPRGKAGAAGTPSPLTMER